MSRAWSYGYTKPWWEHLEAWQWEGTDAPTYLNERNYAKSSKEKTEAIVEVAGYAKEDLTLTYDTAGLLLSFKDKKRNDLVIWFDVNKYDRSKTTATCLNGLLKVVIPLKTTSTKQEIKIE